MASSTPQEPRTFAKIMELEKVPTADGRERYMSKLQALTFDYIPGGPLSKSRSYGGHVFGQSIWAATLGLERESGLQVHEANGYWTQGGFADRPYIYDVTTLSQSRSFAVRQVSVYQPQDPSAQVPFPASDASKPLGELAFTLTCSFKRAEPVDKEFWQGFDAVKYGPRFAQDPTTFPAKPKVPGLTTAQATVLSTYAGIEVRTAELQQYNADKSGTGFRRVHIYHATAPMTHLDPNLHAVAHAYTSDHAGNLFAMGAANSPGAMASLNHKVIFHVDPEELMLLDGKWFVQEMSSPRGGSGRMLIESRIWSLDGVLLVTALQEAVFRYAKQSKLA